MFVFAIAIASVCGSGCGGGAEPPKTAAKTTTNEPKPPRCPPSEDDHPSDAKVRMADLQADIRKCYTLGTPGKSGGSIQLEVKVHESGSVKGAKVLEGAGGHPSAV